MPGVARNAVAAVRVHKVGAVAKCAWAGCTFINVHLTSRARVAWRAVAAEAVDKVGAAAAHARAGQALIDVDRTCRAGKARCAVADEAVDTIAASGPICTRPTGAFIHIELATRAVKAWEACAGLRCSIAHPVDARVGDTPVCRSR